VGGGGGGGVGGRGGGGGGIYHRQTYNVKHKMANSVLNLGTSLRFSEDSYNKTNQMHYFLKFIFGIILYMLRTVPLFIIRSFYHCTHSNVIRTEFRPDPARKLSADLYDIYRCCVYSEKNS
jgi:hypothetical protein